MRSRLATTWASLFHLRGASRTLRAAARRVVPFSFFLLPFAFSPPASASQPRIQFTETTFDFGDVYQNEEVTHAFVFRNTGDAALKIQRVWSTCGCTATAVQGEGGSALTRLEGNPPAWLLAAGATGEIKVTFRGGSYRDRVTKHVYVDTDDPVEPRVTLTVQAVVKVEVQVDPRGVYLGGAIKVGEKVERTIELTPVAVKSFKITSVTADSPLVRVGKPQPLPDQVPGYRLIVTCGPLHQPGRVYANITITTDLPHTKQLVIPVYGKVIAQDASQPMSRQ